MATRLEPPNLGSLRQEQRALRLQLARLRRRMRLELALELAVDAAGVLALTAAVLVLLDWWLRFGVPARGVLLVLCLAGIGALLIVRGTRRYRAGRLDELSLAVLLDRYRPGVGQQVADVLQLPDLLDEPAFSASPALVRMAVRQAAAALGGSDWQSLWNRKRTAAHAALLLVALAAPLAFAALAPEAARLSAARWLLGSAEWWPQRTYLTVMGLDSSGRLLAPRDERVVLEVRTDLPLVEERAGRFLVSGRGEPLSLRRLPGSIETPQAVTVRERTAQGAWRRGIMLAAGPNRLRYEFPPAPETSTFHLSGGDDWLGPLRLERVDRPDLAAITVRVREPGAAYSGFRTVADPRQNLLFLPDTIVELTLAGNEPLADTRLKVHPGKSPALKRIDARTFAAEWTLREAMTLEIGLTSATTALDSRPAFLSIGLLRDREPRVTLRALGVSSHVTPVATIPLALAATDDLGLASLQLQTERVTSGGEKAEPKSQRATVALALPAESGRPVLDHQVRHDVLLQADPPKPGTILRFVGVAQDRCARGAQTGRSSVLQLQVVPPEELFYEVLIRQRAERAKFLAVLESFQKQTPVLAGDPSPEDLVRIMRTDQSGARQLEQIAGRIADTLQEMKLNQVGSEKSHKLLQESVVDPLRALVAGPMNELHRALQALATRNPRGAAKDSARKQHGEVVTKMQVILEQMSQWESFVDVVNQVAEVIRMQQKVLQATQKARETRTQEVFDEKP